MALHQPDKLLKQREKTRDISGEECLITGIQGSVNELINLDFFDESMSICKNDHDFREEILKLLYTPGVDGIRTEYNGGNTKYTAITGVYEFLKSEKQNMTTLGDPLEKIFLETHLATVDRNETMYFLPDIQLNGSLYTQYISKEDHEKICWKEFTDIKIEESTDEQLKAIGAINY